MIKCKCYRNQIGEDFDDCVASVLDMAMHSRSGIVLIFDDVPLKIDRQSTYKSIKFDYMIQSSKKL